MVAVVIAFVLVADAGVLYLHLRDRVSRVGLSAAVNRYRQKVAAGRETPAEPTETTQTLAASTTVASRAPAASTASKAGTGPATRPTSRPAAAAPPKTATVVGPVPGVYSYATQGKEYTSALGGATHDYPATTTITVSETDCGFTARWDALQQRWDEEGDCSSGGATVMRLFALHHEFYGVSDTRTYACPEASFRRPPPSWTAGAEWQFRCLNGSQTLDVASAVVGTEPVTVGGTRVDTVHVNEHDTYGGSDGTGTATTDWWLDTRSGLVVRRVTDLSQEGNSPFGRVKYTENYRIDLLNVSPHQ